MRTRQRVGRRNGTDARNSHGAPLRAGCLLSAMPGTRCQPLSTGVWRGSAGSQGVSHRRSAWPPGRFARAALCGTGRQVARYFAGRGRARSQRRLSHQCYQMPPAEQPHSQEQGDRQLLSLFARANRAGQTAGSVHVGARRCGRTPPDQSAAGSVAAKRPRVRGASARLHISPRLCTANTHDASSRRRGSPPSPAMGIRFVMQESSRAGSQCHVARAFRDGSGVLPVIKHARPKLYYRLVSGFSRAEHLMECRLAQNPHARNTAASPLHSAAIGAPA